MTASSRATAADLRWRRSRPRISRLESRTALARAGTPDSADGSVHDDVDATLVAWPPLTTHLLRKQSQPDLWRQKALDQPQAILRRPAPSLNENPIDLFASSRHGVARYHDDRHPPKAEGGGSPRPRAGRAPAAVPRRAGHWLRTALPLRADDDRGEGALGLGGVPAPAAGGRAGGRVPHAAGQAGGDGAVARRERGAGARSPLISAEAFTARAVSGRAPPRRARVPRPGCAPDARGRRTTRRRSCTRPRCPTAGRRTSRSRSRP